jgi:hypothetical protein
MASALPSCDSKWPFVVFTICLIYTVAAASIGWHNTVLDFIGFRQAQTALTAYFMVGQPPCLAYETPVVGPPWSIPFELPVYQWIVAAVVTIGHTPMDETGRAISLLFFLLTLVPAYRILAWLGFARGHRFLALSLFVVSPFYIFWSRTFLIESTALFFSMCYLAAALPAVDHPSSRRLLAALLFGVLAALVKITTCFVFSMVVLLYLFHIWRGQGQERFRSAQMGRLALLSMPLLGIPFTAGWSWTFYADEQKARNPIGQYLMTSADVMRRWNHGTFAQRITPATWGAILTPAHYALGHGLVFALIPFTLRLAQRRRRIVSACLLVYPVAPLIFTNLYWYHEYYAYANNVFLLAALAVSLLALLERGGRYRIIGLGGLASFFALAVWRHQEYYRPIQETNHEELSTVSRTIQQVTQPDDVLLILGCDWSSELPYYSRRRSLSIPIWLEPNLEKVPEYLHIEPPYRIGALVIRDWGDAFERAAVEQTIRNAGFEVHYLRADEHFEIYTLNRAADAKSPAE